MTTTPGLLHCYPDCSCRREERPMTGPDHPHDGYSYDGCKCTCCRNVRALAWKAEARADVDGQLAEARATIEAMGSDAADLIDAYDELSATRTVLGHLIGDDRGRIHDSGCGVCDAGRALLTNQRTVLPARADVDGLVAALRSVADHHNGEDGHNQNDSCWRNVYALLAGNKAEAPA